MRFRTCEGTTVLASPPICTTPQMPHMSPCKVRGRRPSIFGRSFRECPSPSASDERRCLLDASGMRTLVTGGAGFIGTHLVQSLLERGDDVVVLDVLDAQVHEDQPPALPAAVKFIRGDVGD